MRPSTRLLYLFLCASLTACGGNSSNNTPDAGPIFDAAPPVDAIPPDAGCVPACGPNQTCTMGICACEAPFITCGAECIDPASDENNCGGCVSAGNGEQCVIGVECISGLCEPCNPPNVLCTNGPDECADLNTNPRHCGACDNACVPGATCAPDPVTGIPTCTCPAAQPIACPSGCSDLADTLNCGACGNECVPGAVCGPIPTGGIGCSCPDPGDVACPSGCVDLATDPNNCGGCGNNCTDGASCVSGACVCPVAGEVFCGPGAGCVDLATDMDHCGSCGNDCVGGLETCTSGLCGCAPTVDFCPGIGGASDCHDIASDPSNCGLTCGAADGNNCNTDEYCAAGACACRPGLTDCGGCTDTDTDPMNCGACGAPACAGATPFCEGGACVADCGPGLVTCGGDTCVDQDNDPRHCGGCFNDCAEDDVCVNGECRAYTPTGDCLTCPCARCDTAFGGSTCCSYGAAPICVDDPDCPVP